MKEEEKKKPSEKAEQSLSISGFTEQTRKHFSEIFASTQHCNTIPNFITIFRIWINSKLRIVLQIAICNMKRGVNGKAALAMFNSALFVISVPSAPTALQEYIPFRPVTFFINVFPINKSKLSTRSL
ncbi:unnamed protein product [Brugia timori]|uniref:Uncharacterized protein n=1 Tax=Brugia timori TaxID=42155 RepID=A0A0R3R620_9BILA|nr:unnamed protein product [Brugia timori]